MSRVDKSNENKKALPRSKNEIELFNMATSNYLITNFLEAVLPSSVI